MSRLGSIFYFSVYFCIFPFPAIATTVQPVVLDLHPEGRGVSQQITVENTFSTQLPIELSVQELTLIKDGLKVTGNDKGDLMVFPPQALIEPGQSQAFRIQYVGEPLLNNSKHYYVSVRQLPVKMQEGVSKVQIMYIFRVLVSVAPTGAKPALSVVSSGVEHDATGKPVPIVNIINTSVAHGYLSQNSLHIIQKDAAGTEVFSKVLSSSDIQRTIGYGLIGSKQTRTVQVPFELPLEGGLVEATLIPAQ